MKELQNRKGSFVVIAGPCSAESLDQVMATAKGLSRIGISTFRAGLWKPRSRANHFEGVGSIGLSWMNEVQQQLGMKVMTEVATTCHVEQALKAGIDRLWIGARTTVNPFQMQEIADSLRGVDIPVLVKNPMCPDLELWIGAVERLENAGIKDIRIIHRGFCTVRNAPYRNFPLWKIVEQFRKYYPTIPVLCDPSHISGRKELIKDVCIKALSEQVDGFFIESHQHPEQALSDASQQLTPLELHNLLTELNIRWDES